jgi:hypothetical protein
MKKRAALSRLSTARTSWDEMSSSMKLVRLARAVVVVATAVEAGAVMAEVAVAAEAVAEGAIRLEPALHLDRRNRLF